MSKTKEYRRPGAGELGEAPIGKLLMKLSLPATFAMLVNGLYNLVDTIFIGRGVGTSAIGGLALALPAQMMVMAFGISIGQGAASVVSRNLGAGENEKASKAAGNAFAMVILAGFTVMILGKVFMEPLLNLLGATEALREPARDYLSVVLLGAPFLTLSMVANNLLRSEGKARISMNVMLIGAVTNILLDPVFIFLFKLGVAGAAWATIIGQFFSFLYASRFIFLKKGTAVRIRRTDLIPDGKIVWETLSLGLPTFIRQSGQSIVSVLVNNMLALYGGDMYISAFGVVNRLIMFLMMPLFGTVQGFQPIAGFNYGAKKFDRVRSVIKLTALVATIYTSTVFALLYSMPRVFSGIFTADPQLLDAAAMVIRFIFAAFPLVGFQIVGATYFMVAGKSVPSLVLNLSRQFLFLIPLILILPPLLGLKGLLGSFPAADFLAAIVTAVWFGREMAHLGKATQE
jgi:putative MATE family efflux protein